MKILIVSGLLFFSGLLFAPQQVFAQITIPGANIEGVCPEGSAACSGLDGDIDVISGSDGIISNVIDIGIWAVAIASVFGIVIGGYKYTTSSGNAQSANSARNAVIYSLVGLVVALFAYAIVTFVLGSI